ncbi:MAG: COQ9 family protein [Alphaproteobacteria bacterium]|nr:COQ9 family protein [Alphaproteobacteria bacterium]OJV47043.1 MAG: hypothetical protein BGO28_01165 [Alphaproteobacteria bacterium 43-37]
MEDTALEPKFQLFLHGLNHGLSPDDAFASVQVGYELNLQKQEFLAQLNEYIDEQALTMIGTMEGEKIRFKIFSALWARFQILKMYKPAIQRLVLSGLLPLNTPHTGKLLWETCDRIWYWAGDTSTDFNHYTKRGLLLTILTSSTLYWLKDDSMDHTKTQQFIHKTIEKVMMIPKLKSQAVACLKSMPFVGKIFQ